MTDASGGTSSDKTTVSKILDEYGKIRLVIDDDPVAIVQYALETYGHPVVPRWWIWVGDLTSGAEHLKELERTIKDDSSGPERFPHFSVIIDRHLPERPEKPEKESENEDVENEDVENEDVENEDVEDGMSGRARKTYDWSVCRIESNSSRMGVGSTPSLGAGEKAAVEFKRALSDLWEQAAKLSSTRKSESEAGRATDAERKSVSDRFLFRTSRLRQQPIHSSVDLPKDDSENWIDSFIRWEARNLSSVAPRYSSSDDDAGKRHDATQRLSPQAHNYQLQAIANGLRRTKEEPLQKHVLLTGAGMSLPIAERKLIDDSYACMPYNSELLAHAVCEAITGGWYKYARRVRNPAEGTGMDALQATCSQKALRRQLHRYGEWIGLGYGAQEDSLLLGETLQLAAPKVAEELGLDSAAVIAALDRAIPSVAKALRLAAHPVAQVLEHACGDSTPNQEREPEPFKAKMRSIFESSGSFNSVVNQLGIEKGKNSKSLPEDREQDRRQLNELFRLALRQRIAERSMGVPPQHVYAASLPFDAIVTTNFDLYHELGAREAAAYSASQPSERIDCQRSMELGLAFRPQSLDEPGAGYGVCARLFPLYGSVSAPGGLALTLNEFGNSEHVLDEVLRLSGDQKGTLYIVGHSLDDAHLVPLLQKSIKQGAVDSQWHVYFISPDVKRANTARNALGLSDSQFTALNLRAIEFFHDVWLECKSAGE